MGSDIEGRNTAIAISYGVITLFTSIGLLGLFVRGLWSLKMSLPAQFLAQQAEYDEPPTSPTSTSSNEKCIDVIMDELHKSTSDVKKQPIDEGLQRIIKLHCLIKKQTILIFVAITTDILFYI